MIDLNILKGLSYIGGVNFLEESGYIFQQTTEQENPEYDAIFIHSHFLFDIANNVIDRIYFIEYCIMAEDDELDVINCVWTRNCNV